MKIVLILIYFIIFSSSLFAESENSMNVAAFDMRIYDLEKDIKNLNNYVEDLMFQIEDLKNLDNNLISEDKINDLINIIKQQNILINQYQENFLLLEERIIKLEKILKILE